MDASCLVFIICQHGQTGDFSHNTVVEARPKCIPVMVKCFTLGKMLHIILHYPYFDNNMMQNSRFFMRKAIYLYA